MKEENPPIENPDNISIDNLNENLNNTSLESEYSKWVDNQGFHDFIFNVGR